MTRAEPHPHHPHLPYREWGGGGEGDMARMIDNYVNPRWGFRGEIGVARSTIEYARTAMYNRYFRREAWTDWLGTDFPFGAQEFDTVRQVKRCHPLIRGDARGVFLLVVGSGAFAPKWYISPPLGRHPNAFRSVLNQTKTYPELTR